MNSSTMMAEKTFTVAAEMEDGTTQFLTVRAESPSQAFGQARSMPGVRRVGRVSEGGAAAAGADHGRRERSERRERNAPEPRFAPSGAGSVGIPLAGPRVVLPAPRGGGEQPFRHLKAPPERPKPLPSVTPVAAKPAKASTKPAAPSDVAPTDAAPEYRIVKSRRRDGQPFLLQRGRWQTANGKRAFEVESENGFDTREQAEAHRDTVMQTGDGPTGLQRSA